MTKYLILIGDGMADEPLAQLNHKTILEAAKTPNMDRLAREGIIGLAKTIPASLPAGSDTAMLSIFGYDPTVYYTGRAPLEAASMKVPAQPNDVFVRCNLVVIEDEKMIDYSGSHIATADAQRLIAALNENLSTPSIEFFSGVSYRHILRLRDIAVDALTTPPHDILECTVLPYLPINGVGADILRELMEKSSAIFRNHAVNQERIKLGQKPITSIWLWGYGTMPQLPLLASQFQVSGAMITAVDLVKGIGTLAGMDYISVPGITGYIDTNYCGKAAAAIEALKTYDLVLVHVEAPDEAGHLGDAALKIRAVEDFDTYIVGELMNQCEDTRILVMPDHPTPVAKRTHTRDPVPFAIWTAGLERKQTYGTVHGFSEIEARKGIYIEKGYELLSRFLSDFFI